MARLIISAVLSLAITAAFIVGFLQHRKQEIWQLTDVTGHLPDLRFDLTDDQGQPEQASAYHGKVVLLTFGFAGCSAQCPLTLQRLTDLLGKADRNGDARVLFVTVDTDHDTPAALHSYLSSFDPRRMTGLTGTSATIEKLAQRYRAPYRPVINGATIVHSNVIYIFDRQGHARLIATPEDNDEQMLHDLRQLMHV